MTKKRPTKKAVPTLTRIEKNRAAEINELIRSGIDPLTVTRYTSGGEARYTLEDIAIYYRLFGVSFMLIASSFEYQGLEQYTKQVQGA